MAGVSQKSLRLDFSFLFCFAVPLGSIIEIRLGQQTDFFNKFGTNYDPVACFSILYGREQQPSVLNLVAATPEQCEQFVAGLHLLIDDSSGEMPGVSL